jgi:hypothetical protein
MPEVGGTSLMDPTGDRPGSRRHAGASAETQFQRRRRAHRTKTRVRVLATALGAMTLALLVALAGPPLFGRGATLAMVAILLLAAVPLALRQQATPWWVSNWRRGAAGERHAARILGRLGRRGYWLLNDLQVPRSKANLDHLLIGPTGVFYVDAKSGRAPCGWAVTGACGTTAAPAPSGSAPCDGRPSRHSRCWPTSRSSFQSWHWSAV